jgi:hypothetical protein
MPDTRLPKLRVVDGLRLAEPYQAVLRPGVIVEDTEGRGRRLPRFFYEIDSWKTAKEIQLAPDFGLYEFIQTDLREAKILHGFPRYVPCAVLLLASLLALFRQRVGTYVRIAANGAYRSPQHALARDASTHHWGTAVNIFQIGDEYLDNQESIEKYAAIAQEVVPWIWARPYGHNFGFADDHLHLDLGYVTVVPREAAGETNEKNASTE